MEKSLKIIFFGTPEFAAQSLKEIIDSKHKVVGVVTAPDRPAGRGRKLQSSAVKKLAENQNIKVLQPEKLKAKNFISELKSLEADLFVVVAFRKLPKVIWSMPEIGTINLHGSILPNYRGAAPINWAVINGETETGVTVFFINEKIDAGEMISNAKLSIDFSDTAGIVHDKMMVLGAKHLLETINNIAKGSIQTTSQKFDPEINKTAPKIFSEDCKIDWSKDLEEIYNLIRGMSPYPGAFTFVELGGKKNRLKILETKVYIGEELSNKSEIKIEDSKLRIYFQNGILELLKVQPQNKPVMSSKDFINGLNGLKFIQII